MAANQGAATTRSVAVFLVGVSIVFGIVAVIGVVLVVIFIFVLLLDLIVNVEGSDILLFAFNRTGEGASVPQSQCRLVAWDDIARGSQPSTRPEGVPRGVGSQRISAVGGGEGGHLR